MTLEDFLEANAQALNALKAELTSRARPALGFDLIEGGETGLMTSRAGGSVAWPVGRTLPLDRHGKAMHFLLQLNLAEFPALPDFPADGLLQVFLSNMVNEHAIIFRDGRFPREDRFPIVQGDGFALVYHPEGTPLVETAWERPKADYPITAEGYETTATALTLYSEEAMIPPDTNWHAQDIATKLHSLVQTHGDGGIDMYELTMHVFADSDPAGLQIGGYASPLQMDQRSVFEDARAYDRCVLNLTAFEGFDVPDMNFAILIGSGDLRARRFERSILIADTD
ncbi:DUF1963 domain-containing protein [Tropicibacter sp. S64]|uniref:DUF1963 domain-containing protein n=1 Tax=Tropicibacter sp. S64 TaxID=3415122 RepID=UPI003C7D9395